jgi:tetratricopeptide (TPR) repeat protein/SAM-dependent methyltransferase
MKKSYIHEIYDHDYARNYNQRFLLQENLSKIDSDFEVSVIRSLLEEIGHDATWLDIACGTGYYLSHFPETQRAGLDISPAMLQVAQEANSGISFIEGDYRDRHPEWNAKWDLVSCMFWAYAYVDSLSEIEQVIENFASWTSDKGICFLPICDPSELGSGEVHIPYITEHIGEGGFYQLEALTWSWIENPEKQHRNLITPHPEWMITQFKKYFDDVRIVEYPKVKRHRIALVARSKKRRPDNQKVNLSIQKLVRSQEWWLYKIAPLLTIAYAEILLLQLPPTTATLTTLTTLFSITSVAAYGYLLNDICDIETDHKANKPNAAANLQPGQRLLLCLLFLITGFAAPLLTHLGTVPIALLTANYLLPTLYSVPPLRLKERGIWGILSDAAGAHLVPTLFVAATVLSPTPDPQRNALLFTGLAAAHAFFVGLRGILLHQLWDRDNDTKSHTTTFVSQRDPETVRRWINRFVFPVEIALLGSVAVLLSRSAPALIPVFVVYILFTFVRLRVARENLNPSPSVGQNIVPHDLYEVWLPLALATLLASRDFHYVGFVALTLVLFFPAVKNRIIELFGILKAAILLAQCNLTASDAEPEVLKELKKANDEETGEAESEAQRESENENGSEIEEAIAIPSTNVTPLTPEMQQQLETEGYVVLENFLTPDELDDLREFDRAHPLPEEMAASDRPQTIATSDLIYRKKFSDKFKSIAAPKLKTIIPGYRTLFCPWFRKKSNSKNNPIHIHQDPSFTDETQYSSLGIWCPLNDVDFEGSCLYIVKGSHRLNLQKRSYNLVFLPYDEKIVSYIADNYLTPISLKAGQAILFDKRLIHGSPPNTSNVERVAATCFTIIPDEAPLYCCYQTSKDTKQLEIYEVPDDFYDRYIYGEKPSGDGINLVKTEPYTYDPLTPELIAKKLDPLHPDRAITRLKTEQAQTQTQLQYTETELNQLKAYLQQTQGTEGLINYYQFRIASDPDNIQLYQQVLTIQPNNAIIYRQLGNALARQNRFSEAIASYQTALNLQPDDFEIYLELGKVYEKQENWVEAIAAFRHAVELNPDYSWSHKYLGDVIAEQGELNEASLCYRRALQLQPRITLQK